MRRPLQDGVADGREPLLKTLLLQMECMAPQCPAALGPHAGRFCHKATGVPRGSDPSGDT